MAQAPLLSDKMNRAIVGLSIFSILGSIAAQAEDRVPVAPIQSTSNQRFSCSYHLRPIGQIISEAPVDANGAEFRAEMLKLIPKLINLNSLQDISDIVIQKRFEMAKNQGTYFAYQMSDLGKARFTGKTNEPCISYGNYGSMRNEKILNFLAAYLGPPTKIRTNVDLSIYKNVPNYVERAKDHPVKVWKISGKKETFEIYSPSFKEFYFEHSKAKNVPGLVKEADRLWHRSLNAKLTTHDRVKALAEFEWLWFWANPYGRSGALTGDILSLISQQRMVKEGHKILVRSDYYTQDMEALIRDEKDYIANRIKELMLDAEGERLRFPEMNFRHIGHDRMWKWLHELDAGGSRVIDFLSTDIRIKRLFGHDAGVKENLTIREHTLMVYDSFVEQFGFYDFSKVQEKLKFNVHDFFMFIIAIHDLGKPFAVEAGNRALQHQFTESLIKTLMGDLGFSLKEISVASEIISNNALGEALQEHITIKRAIEKLRESAQRLGLTTAEYFSLQTFFFVVDTSAYPFLRERLYRPLTPSSSATEILSSGSDRLIFSNEIYHQLKARIGE